VAVTCQCGDCGIGMIEEGVVKLGSSREFAVPVSLSYRWVSVLIRATISGVFDGPTSLGCPSCR
jgi:hypothetical protein